MAFLRTTHQTLPLPEAVADLRAGVLSFKPLAGAAALWRRIEIPLEPLDIKAFLKAQGVSPLFYWQPRGGHDEAGGLGAADEIRSDDHCAAHQFSMITGDFFKDLPAGMRYFGGASFDARHGSAAWDAFPSLWFFLPRLEITRCGQAFMMAVHFRSDGGDKDAALKALDALRYPSGEEKNVRISARRERDLSDRAGWQRSVDGILQSIADRRVEKVVLARRTDFVLESPVSSFDILRKLQGMTDGCFHFLCQPASGVSFYGASPERLYKRSGRTVQSEAMAGTRPAGNTQEEAGRFRDELADSAKETREQAFVVSAVRSALAGLTADLQVDGAPRVVEVMGGQHLVSGVEGALAGGVDDADILARLHPTPAVAGVPTEDALTMIHQFEPFSRGWYAGPVGWIGRDGSEFAVAIRSGLLCGDRLSVFGGAGIVSGSEPSREWDEVEQKISSTLKVLS